MLNSTENSSANYFGQTATTLSANKLEPYLQALAQLPANDLQIVLTVVRSLAERNGITIAANAAPSEQTLQKGIPLWIACLKAEQYSPRTIEQYLLVVRKYIKLDSQPTFLSIQHYLATRLGQVSSSRVNTDRKALRSYFRFIHTIGLWPTDPTQNLKPIRVKYKEREIPKDEDITKLLKEPCYCKKDTEKFRLMVVLLLDTGLRINEACSILKDNIYFDSLGIKVTGKGGNERFVPISEYTGKLLETWLKAHPDTKWLFPANNAWGYWDERSFEKTMKRQCQRCGIKPFSPHALRHYFATHNLRNGARLEIVSKILGHASIAITADLYCHIDREEIHEAHRRYSPFTKLVLSLEC